MKWFDRWFFRKCQWAWENRDTIVIPDDCAPTNRKTTQGRLTAGRLTALTADVEESWGDGLRMNVRKIIGGYVVSFRTYDHVKDRSDEKHYLITDEQDFNLELGKMITMESMRQT